MAHDNDQNPPISPYPNPVTQNPAPPNLVREPVERSGTSEPQQGMDFEAAFKAQVNAIMGTFLSVLPDNYVSQINGPFYTLQFQGMAEALARIQLTAQQISLDSTYDFTRSEFLWEILGGIVFPGATASGGAPQIDGDITYREFLHRMLLIILKGSTPAALEEAVKLLLDPEAEVTIIEKFLAAREEGSDWGFDEQFEFEVDIFNDNKFPDNPFTTLENIKLILEALKPAHTLFDLRFLFKEVFGPIFDDTGGLSWSLDSYYYDDFRKYCLGAKEIFGFEGETLSDLFLFQDNSVAFDSISTGAVLIISTGPNTGQYQVREILGFTRSLDTTPRAYTTSPTGLTGTATVTSNNTLKDESQNWGLVAEGEVLTFTEGPNIGSYRLKTLLGPNGGPIGSENATGPATEVKIAFTTLRLVERMTQAATSQPYTVTVDRLGTSIPKDRVLEDSSEQFYT